MGFFDFLTTKSARRTAKPRITTRRLRAPVVANSAGGWVPVGGVERAPSALPLVRARARDLSDNSPYGVRAVRVLTDQSVGSGIRYRIAGDPEYRAALNAWSQSTDCDYSGMQSLFSLQATAVATMIAAGDVLWVFRQKTTADGGLSLTIQLIDPDQIDISAQPKYAGNEVLQGVEVGPTGIVIGYHVKKRASDSMLGGHGETDFLYANQCCLMFERLFPGQLRGIPRGAAALEKLHQTDSFLSAAIAKARTEACLSVFLTVPASEDGAGGLLGEIDEGEDDTHTVPEVLDPGSVSVLPEGYDVKVITPSASGGLTDYIKKTIEAVSVGYGCMYYHISGDVTGFTYSSGKLGLTDFLRGIDTLRSHTIYPVLLRIEQAFRETHELSTDADVTASIRMVPPARESMEPAKEVLAELSELAAGLLPLEEAWLRRGLDPDDMWKSLEDQAKKLANLKMPLKFGSLDLSLIVEKDEKDAE